MRGLVLALAALALPLIAQDQREPFPVGSLAARTLPGDWHERDLEGKWVAYRAAMAADSGGKLALSWAMALGEQRELELLEWIAMYEGWQHAGPQLRKHDAPQWVRAAVWNLGAFDSHAKDAAKKALLADAARVLGWFEAYPAAATGLGKELRDRLAAMGVEAKRDVADLPPLDAMQWLVPFLDAPAKLESFGLRKTAAKRVRYEHQVVRALGAVLMYGDRDDRIAVKVIRLVRHGNETISRAAFDALAKLPAGLVPYAAMRAIVMDEQASDRMRRSAVVVLSFSSHPLAMDLLAELALQPEHVAADVAVEQLKQRGDPVIADQLAHVEVATAELERAIDRVVLAADQRHKQGVFGTTPELHRLLLRVAYLRETKDERAPAVADATKRLLRRGPGDWRKAIEQFLAGPMPRLPFVGEERAALAKGMRDYANSLLAE